jgi:hypothetical protein
MPATNRQSKVQLTAKLETSEKTAAEDLSDAHPFVIVVLGDIHATVGGGLSDQSVACSPGKSGATLVAAATPIARPHVIDSQSFSRLSTPAHVMQCRRVQAPLCRRLLLTCDK